MHRTAIGCFGSMPLLSAFVWNCVKIIGFFLEFTLVILLYTAIYLGFKIKKRKRKKVLYRREHSDMVLQMLGNSCISIFYSEINCIANNMHTCFRSFIWKVFFGVFSFTFTSITMVYTCLQLSEKPLEIC